VATVRDLYAQKTLGNFTGSFIGNVDIHDGLMLKVGRRFASLSSLIAVACSCGRCVALACVPSAACVARLLRSGL
jgi:hypothetical protein